MARRPFRGRGALLVAGGAALVLAALVGGLSLTLPGFMARDYDAKSLASLRRQAVRTKERFAGLRASLEARKSRFAVADMPGDAADFFPLFRASGLDPENQGIALCNGDGLMEAWYGNVLSPADQIGRDELESQKSGGATFLVASKASVYLVAVQSLGGSGRMLVHFSRLAFIPKVQSSYIREFHALRPAQGFDFDIEYYGFREDIEGWEKFFALHSDEYVGQPRQRNEIQTLFFPLRNETGRIVAAVTLASPSLTARLTAAREDLRLIVIVLLIIAAGLALSYFWSAPGFLRGRDILSGAIGAVLLVGLRLLALPLGQLERIQSLGLFQPAVAGFVSWRGLTQSPADMFLTALAVLGLAVCLAVCASGRRGEPVEDPRSGRGLLVLLLILSAGLAAGALAALRMVVRSVVFNSNLSLVRWDFDLSRLAMQLGLFVVLAAVLLLLAVAFRTAFRDPRARVAAGLVVTLAAAAAAGLGPGPQILLVAASAALIGWLFAVSVVPGLARRREIWVAGLILAALWLARSVDGLTVDRTHRLIETTVAHVIQTQENWGNFLVQESLPGLDRRERQILEFFKDYPPQDSEFAHGLWKETPVAKSNWYSCLEVRDAEGTTVSRFSLNVPRFLGGAPDLPYSETWAIVPYSQTFIGKKRDYLVGYKDFTVDGAPRGRVVLYVSIDPEMLPFLYSANPYFEVLRTDSLPSLGQIDLGCEIFDLDGRSLFNPSKLTAGLSAAGLS
ncbi:MAG TPA: hypothetical protein VKT17_03595, partial [Acidobacteriota bacterium]|nr:hypothetical protein [Acidobacteriota bacterium]